ncbi:MAG: alpha-L-rhamnosidase C-terminal domain-containing protein [Cytophagaceae bacterium]
MKIFYFRLIILQACLLGASIQTLFAQEPSISEATRLKQWTAHWITVPDELKRTDGIYLFRKIISVTDISGPFIIHVSGDNRYKLFVNGKQVSFGPARGDVMHWNYETVDIAPYLVKGENIISSIVWNYGAFMPEAQTSYRTGFIVHGETEREKIADTDKSWKCIRHQGYSFLKPDLGYATYYVANPGEKVIFGQSPQNWTSLSFDDSSWKNAVTILPGIPKGFSTWDSGWQLIPRSVSQMELREERLSAVRLSEGISAPSDFLKKPVEFLIPANKKVRLILDQGFITDAFPVLKFRKGKSALITIGYAESLYLKDGYSPERNNAKGNRNEVSGKLFLGYRDELLADGNSNTFVPLTFRVFRYIELVLETKSEELIIDDFYGIFSAYPYQLKSSFKTSGNNELDKILEVGWRTFRLCSQETFVDCPYYEQVQYIGDTRIESLISLYNTSDDRLVRNAIQMFDNSRISEGITWCRWPANDPQFIPPFSLRWIEMIHDYHMLRDDSAFVSSMLPGIRSVLSFFEKRQNQHLILENVPYWNFMDWVNGWQYGMAPADHLKRSATMDMQLLTAYKVAAELEQSLGDNSVGEKYIKSAQQLSQQVKNYYWDKEKKYFSDTPDKKSFSQHANALAVLAGIIDGEEATLLMKRTLTDSTLYQCSLYFRYYLNQAAVKAGLGDQYPELLGEWKAQLSRGMTTWAESPEPTRSECHAWGSSPNIEVYRTILGIKSGAPGFRKVIIQPHIGKLNNVEGSIPHPAGEIKVKYTLDKKGSLNAIIELPPGTSGTFIWKGKTTELKQGNQILKL